jgi:hypothetical protein
LIAAAVIYSDCDGDYDEESDEKGRDKEMPIPAQFFICYEKASHMFASWIVSRNTSCTCGTSPATI